MPKSRFNAVRERARATRHDPIGGKKKDAKENQEGFSMSSTTTATISTPPPEDVIPILKSLPLDSTSTVSPSEVLWALTSVTGFLSEKVTRTQVLLPQHKVIPRVLFQLHSQNDDQIRDAASGCLRNLCIEAGGKQCKVLEEHGCVERCIEEMKATAKKLALVEGEMPGTGEADEVPQEKKEEAVQLLKKPKNSLNRKERRQLAKLEEAAAKRKAKSGGEDVDMNDGLISSKDLEQVATEKDQEEEKEADVEQQLLLYSHMTNLVTVLWCLVELSPKAVDVCSRSAHSLSKVLISTLDKTRKSLELLCRTEYSVEGDDVTVDAKWRDVTLLDLAIIKLATTALNAMVTLTDSNPDFSAAVIGVSRETLRHSQKTTKKGFVLEEGGDETGDEMRQDGINNVHALIRAMYTSEELYHVDERPRTDRVALLQRQGTTLSVLSIATVRNMQSSLPDALRKSIKFPDYEDESAQTHSSYLKEKEEDKIRTLGQFEMVHVVPCLRHIVYLLVGEGEDSSEVETVFVTLDSKNTGSLYLSKVEMEKKLDTDLNNLSLALEVAAELAREPEGWYGQSGQSKQRDDVITVDEDEEEDEEMDEDMEGEENDSDISLSVPEEGQINDGDTPAALDFDKTRNARLLDEFAYYIDNAGKETRDGFLLPKKEKDGSDFDDSVAASLRSIEIRALSALNNICLGIASFGQVPPSQPQKADLVTTSFQIWLRKKDGRISGCWENQFELASLLAALPCLSRDGDNDDSSLAQDARKAMELCLCIMWSVARCYEGIDGQTTKKALPMTPSDFAERKYSDLPRAKASLGVIPSLIAAYKTSKNISAPPCTTQEPSTAAVHLTPTPDGIRTHSLGVLSTLVRQSFVSMQDKEKIATLLVDVLDVLPTANDLQSRLHSLGICDSTSMDAMVVAVNGIIDTFANEESQWDSLYGQLRLQSRLKRASLDVKSAARTIDKRKQPALRAAADEAWSNLVGFLQYRESLAK